MEKLKKRDDYGHMSSPKRHVLIALLLILKRDGQEKPSKILISWQKLKNQLFPFSFQYNKNLSSLLICDGNT